MPLKLVIANKAYSSWSLRAWILLAHFKIPFEEVVIPLDLPDTRKKILKFAPSGRCPSLHDGGIHVWDTMAINEFIAEKYPGKDIWPRGKAARADARSISAEMHSGFQSLRAHCPMNFFRAPKKLALTPAVEADVARIESAWASARKNFGGRGDFLYGKFSVADAIFAPVVNRLHVYDIKVGRATRAYMDAMMALPAWKAWEKDALAETWRIEKYDAV